MRQTAQFYRRLDDAESAANQLVLTLKAAITAAEGSDMKDAIETLSEIVEIIKHRLEVLGTPI